MAQLLNTFSVSGGWQFELGGPGKLSSTRSIGIMETINYFCLLKYFVL